MNNAALVWNKIYQIKDAMKDMDVSVSTGSDRVEEFQAIVSTLSKGLEELKDKCEDMKGRRCRFNNQVK